MASIRWNKNENLWGVCMGGGPAKGPREGGWVVGGGGGADAHVGSDVIYEFKLNFDFNLSISPNFWKLS